MDISFRQIVGSSVLREEDGAVLGLVKDVIMDPARGKLVGLWVRPATLPMEYAVLPTDSILKWKKHIYIQADSDMAEAEDFLKLSKILEEGILIIGKQVVTEDGESLGKVEDMSIEIQTYRLKNIIVDRKFLLFSVAKRLIPRGSIIRIEKDQIIVRHLGDIKEKAPEVMEGPVMEV
jgi:uncharacterized protein YrrD